jgi:hypothetical protein
MTHDTILVIAWLVLAHFVADFVLQSGTIERAKSSRGSAALGGLLAHGLIVAASLIPAGLAFGDRGWLLVAVAGVSHVLIDRTKVVLTRRAATGALREAHEQHTADEGPQPADHLGRAWTPRPAALFLADQGAHLLVLGWAWAVLLASTPLTVGWTATVDGWLGGWDRAAVHAIVSGFLIVTTLAIVNVRAAALFVGILVRPVEVGVDGEQRWGGRVTPAEPVASGGATTAVGGPAPAAASIGARRWTIRLGPLDARITAEPDRPESSRPATAGPGAGANVVVTPPLGASARVGATIGILERILTVTFVMTGTDVAIGFVVAAKTLARFRLLDDRAFAEYYLLGTLASVSVAILTGITGRVALGALLS